VTDLNPVVLMLTGAIVALTFLTFLYLLWKRAWSWLGLYVAVGGLFYVPAYGAIPILMAFEPSYAEKPVQLAAFAWPFGLGWGLLAGAICGLQASAMIDALQRPTPRSSAAIIVCSAYNLLATALGFFEQWVASGDLPTFRLEGGQLSVWVGFPIIFLLTICPYLFAIPWGILRLAEAASGTARAVLSRYWQMAGTVLVLLAVIGAAIGIGIAKGTWLGSGRDWRAVMLLAGALGLACAILLFAIFSFRRTFLVPAIAIIEGISNDQSLASVIKPGSLWQPMVDTLDSTRSQVRERGAQLKAFFDNLPTSIYLKTIDHTVIYVSKHLAEQYGKRPEDMVGKYEYDLHIEAMKPLLMAMDEHIMSTGEAVLTEGKHLQFDRLELVSRFPVFNDQGEITHIGGMNFDIDARARAQAELAESKALIDAFIQNAPNSMVLMKPDGHYVMINNAAARYYDKTPDELLVAGAKILNAPFLEARTEIIPMMARVIANREGETIETPFVMPSGDVHDIAFTLFPILGADGEVAFVGNISHDITDERRAQADLAKSTDALHQSEKLAALGSMLAGVSHELNNPLAAVIGQTALLAEDLEGTPHAERVSKIRRAADRCARIVKSFLAMARQKAPEYRSVSINDQVRSAVELTEYQMRAAQVVLDLRLSDGLPNVEADPDELHQVIANLLTNARQALEEVSGERRITLTTSRERDMISLSVADTGKGIDAATRDRIFDPFFTTKAVGSGTGIGLSYSLGIIEAHGGTIRIEDADVGTTFVITLPVKDDTTDTAAPEQAEEARTKGRALVIDDEEDVADTLSDMLQRQGLEVSVAIGGLAGQAAMAGDAHFDVILSDIRMPDLDGPALYDWMVTNRADLLGSIAFVTGDTLSGIASDFIARSGCAVLEKPFTPAALRELVTAMLEGDPK
jgi:PAS domain S-box-containing protein